MLRCRWVCLVVVVACTSAREPTEEPTPVAVDAAGPAPAPSSEPSPDPSPDPSPTPAAAQPPKADGVVGKATGKCVTAPFPEVHGPPDIGATMSITKAPRRFGAITCAGEREVWIDPKGKLHVCTIARPMKLHGLALAGDNYTRFHPNGRPEQTTLAAEHEIASGDGTVIPCAAEHAVLDAAGKVEHCQLARTMRVGKIECTGGEDIALRTDGTLWACTVVGSLALVDATIVGGTRVAFHPSGAVESAGVRDTLVIGGIRVRNEVKLHANGNFAQYTLGEPRTIGGIVLDDFADAWFYEDGSPWHLEYVADSGHMVHGEPWRDTRRVTFDCTGKIVDDDTEHFVAPTRPRPPRGIED